MSALFLFWILVSAKKLTNLALMGFTAVFTALMLLAPLQAQELDRIVAIVDSGIVTKSQLDERVEAIRDRFADDPAQLPPLDVLREQVLDRLIIEELQLQMASRGGIRISDQEIDQAFAELAISNGMEPNAFLEELTRSGSSSVTKVIRDLQNELTIQRLQQIQVPQRIRITNAEIDSFLESAEGRIWTAPELLLQHIFLELPSTAGPEQVNLVEETAERVIREFNSGSDFGNLATQYSSSTTALDGGQIGWRRAIEFAPEIGDPLEEVNPGDLVGPIRGAGGIHLFYVNDKRGADDEAMIQQTETRHILIRPNEIRSEEEARELIELIAERLEEGEGFEELARIYSDDVANALDGGYLGWVLPGQMVPEFEAATDLTEVGEVSEPILTSFGWHVLKVDARRDVDMSDQLLRQQASNLIGDQRFEEETDLWVRELRSEAFIQILDY